MPGKIRLAKKLMAKKLGEEWVFLNLENGVYYGLNETGSRIWEELAEEKDSELLLDRLSQGFNVDRQTLKKDLKDFLADLRKEGLIKIESSGS